MNFKNITEVEEVSEIKETDKVILNVDGKAKQANANLIRPKEEHLYIKVGVEQGSSPGDKNFTLTESNLKYDFLLENFKKYNYIPISLELSFQTEPPMIASIRTYGATIDAQYYPPAVEGGVKGLLLLYTDISLNPIAGGPLCILVKPNNGIEIVPL